MSSTANSVGARAVEVDVGLGGRALDDVEPWTVETIRFDGLNKL